MIEVLESNLRKQSKANAAAFLLALSIVFAVVFGVNIYVGPKGPMPGMTIPSLIGAIVFFIIWWVLYNRMKIKLTMTMDKQGEYYITVPLKDGETIQLNKISAIEPFFARVHYGKGPRMKDIYLKIFDEAGNNSLTLFHNLGAIYDDPDGFWELEDRDLFKHDKGKAIYFSKDIQEIYYTLKDCKWVTVRQPVV